MLFDDFGDHVIHVKYPWQRRAVMDFLLDGGFIDDTFPVKEILGACDRDFREDSCFDLSNTGWRGYCDKQWFEEHGMTPVPFDTYDWSGIGDIIAKESDDAFASFIDGVIM